MSEQLPPPNTPPVDISAPVPASTPALTPAPQQPASQHQPMQPPQPQPQPMQPPSQPQTSQPQYYAPQVAQLGSGKHRVHSSYVWVTAITLGFSFLITAFLVVVPMVFGESVSQGRISSNISLVLILTVVGIVVLFGIILVLQVLSYRNLYFEFTNSEFNLYSGIITKKRVHVPYQRVQSVNHNATLIQRIVGVCSVSIETAGGSTNKAIKVPFVQNIVAEQIRAELFNRKAAVLQQEQFSQAAVAAKATGSAGDVLYAPPSTGTAPVDIPAPVRHAPPAAGAVPFDFPAPVGGSAPATGSLPAAGPVVAASPTNSLDRAVGEFATERGVFGGAAYHTGAISYQHSLSNKELLLSAVSNSSSGVAIVISVIVSVFGFLGSEAVSYFTNYLFAGIGIDNAQIISATGSIIQRAVLPSVIVLIFFVIVVWLIAVGAACIQFGGFSACRRQNRIEVEHGLLQRQFSGLDIERVQSVVVRQSFIRRCIGYCELSLGRIDSADQARDKNQKNVLANRGLVIHPFVKLGRVPEILAGLVPEYADLPVEQTKPPKVARRRALIRKCIWTSGTFWVALPIALVQIIVNILVNIGVIDTGSDPVSTDLLLQIVNTAAVIVYIFYGITLIVGIISAILWYRTSAFAYNRHFMTIKNGGLSTEAISFARKKIQYGYTKTNPFQRLSKVASINVVTAAGIGGTTTRLMDVSQAEASAWLDWLLPGGNKALNIAEK